MFVVRRALRGLLTLWVIATVIFIAMRVSSDPTQYMLPPGVDEAQRADLRHQLGLDANLGVQYLQYVGRVLTGDFGLSFFSTRPVTDVLFERVPATLQLMVPSLVVAIAIGIPAGVLAAINRNTILDRALMSASFVSQATPNFVLGIGLILLFSLALKILPSSGIGTWQHSVMPIATLGTMTSASIARLTRSSMLDVLNRPFMMFARGRGLSATSIFC